MLNRWRVLNHLAEGWFEDGRMRENRVCLSLSVEVALFPISKKDACHPFPVFLVEVVWLGSYHCLTRGLQVSECTFQTERL